MTKHKKTKHKKEQWYGRPPHSLPDGSYIDIDGNICYVKDGKWHKEDGPAIEWSSGRKEWYRNGKYHREDGPAREWDIYAAWYVDGRKHDTKKEYEEALKIWKMNEAMK